MPHPNQNPDDLTCKPARFSTWDKDGCVQTYEIRSPWDLVGTTRLGELIVTEKPGGPLVKISAECESWLDG